MSTQNWHRLSELDKLLRTAVCSICGPVHIVNKDNTGTSWRCGKRDQQLVRESMSRRIAAGTKDGHKHHRKGYCERCGFIPEHVCQLDGHHKDGNHKNNDPNNVETLCANCHRYVTWLQKLRRHHVARQRYPSTQRTILHFGEQYGD